MPSGLQLPPVQLRAGLLPSCTLRLCVHVCVYGMDLLYIYLNFSVWVLLKWFWMWVVSVLTVLSSEQPFNEQHSFNWKCMKQMAIKDFYIAEGIPITAVQWRYFLPPTLKCCMFIMAALLKGLVLCTFGFHACSVHVDCRFPSYIICKIWAFMKCIVRPFVFNCL